jgi:hypothetical protein
MGAPGKYLARMIPFLCLQITRLDSEHMVRLFEMTQLKGFSPEKLLLLLVKMFIEIFPFIYIQCDLLERLERKHCYPCSLYTLTKSGRKALNIDKLAYNSIIKYHFKNHSIRIKRETHRYPWYRTYREKSFMLKMNKKLSVVPVSLVPF